ncbi:MAG: glycosyl transferase family 2 [Chloroflexi bacterium]|nr:glycosyl transferase family 2 [Chloroflexota bacterium]
MDQRTRECLDGRPATEYILPFFWQHGEDHATLLEELDAIYRAGLREFCVESRTHEQFCQEAWWVDFGMLLAEAEKRGMRVWLLDDKHFPTGYANNTIADHPELRRKLLRADYYDFAGPRPHAALLAPRLAEGERLVAVVAYQRTQRGAILAGQGVDLRPMLSDGLLFWDIPAGAWRAFYLIETVVTEADDNPNYIDMLSAASCHALMDAVHEPHYQHFARYFGNTFAGFFSDEPCFNNDVGNYESKLGKPNMRIPWSEEMPARIAAEAGIGADEALLLLPALWQTVEGRTEALRVAYMSAASAAFRDNFSVAVGDWCRAHGVQYIGHIIEDMGTHQRLGHGPGHFFRGLAGQDMAGIDIVLMQFIPGYTDLDHRAMVFGDVADPRLFNYTLPKLGASLAHSEPRMRGRAMCEIYGAFGWAAGLPVMKHMTDHMLVSGINHFVPHAFTPRYPDPDCPPHFYARGRNPQFALFGRLMDYTTRCAHLLSGGVHQADVAVWYNAESDWCGRAYTTLDDVCAALLRSQIDLDLVPTDTLEQAAVVDGRLVVNQESYGALVVPWAEWLPERLRSILRRLEAAGLAVIECREPEALPAALRERGCAHLTLSQPEPDLLFHHIRRDGRDIWMLFNQNPFRDLDLRLPIGSPCCLYDAWENRLTRPQSEPGAIRLRLPPSGALFVLEGEAPDGLPAHDDGDAPMQTLQLDWTVSLRAAGSGEWKPYRRTTELANLAPDLPTFCGTIRYEATLTAERAYTRLDLGLVGETAELWVNGRPCGARISPPYRFACEFRPGANQIVVEVVNNPAYRERDVFSQFMPLPPTGLLGPVSVG